MSSSREVKRRKAAELAFRRQTPQELRSGSQEEEEFRSLVATKKMGVGSATSKETSHLTAGGVLTISSKDIIRLVVVVVAGEEDIVVGTAADLIVVVVVDIITITDKVITINKVAMITVSRNRVSGEIVESRRSKVHTSSRKTFLAVKLQGCKIFPRRITEAVPRRTRLMEPLDSWHKSNFEALLQTFKRRRPMILS